MLAVRALVVLAGIAASLGTVLSAVRTVVLPRATPARLTRGVFAAVRAIYDARLARVRSYAERDAVMATFAPLCLLALLLTWLVIVYFAFTGVFWGLGAHLDGALEISGSSLTTLGFNHPPGLDGVGGAVGEALIGLALLALLITYLPALYAAFKARETPVAKLQVRAGDPPSGVELLWRIAVLGRLDRLRGLWEEWETFFVDIEESHSSFPVLVFFRSPQPTQSWVTSAGAVLDGAALWLSSVEGVHDVDAQLTLRAGYLSLRRICGFFGLEFPADPQQGDPVSVRREEYDAALDRLAAAGLRLRPDRDAAWRDFAGWRVNYDAPLLALAALTMAPYAPWSSDRSLAHGAAVR